MREFLDIMAKDIEKENFSRRELLIYGVVAPVSLLVIMAIAGWMETTMP